MRINTGVFVLIHACFQINTKELTKKLSVFHNFLRIESKILHSLNCNLMCNVIIQVWIMLVSQIGST